MRHLRRGVTSPSVRYRDCFGIRTLCFLEQTIATRNEARFPHVQGFSGRFVWVLPAPVALPTPTCPHPSLHTLQTPVLSGIGAPYSPPARMGELWLFICVI